MSCKYCSVNTQHPHSTGYVVYARQIELYAGIVLNAMVGNTDDHPCNTSLRQGGLGDWELSPLYDVMPLFARQGVPVFRMDITRLRPSRAATRANLLAAGKHLAGLEEGAALAVIENTLASMRDNWRRVFSPHGKHHPGSRPDDWPYEIKKFSTASE